MTLDAKCIFIKVANLHSSKPNSWHVHCIFLPSCLQCTMKIKDWFYCTFHRLQMLTLQCGNKIKKYLIILAMWCKIGRTFVQISHWLALSLEILSSFVTSWVALFMACWKHAPSKGLYKFNASQEIIDVKLEVMFTKLMPSSFT